MLTPLVDTGRTDLLTGRRIFAVDSVNKDTIIGLPALQTAKHYMVPYDTNDKLLLDPKQAKQFLYVDWHFQFV